MSGQTSDRIKNAILPVMIVSLAIGSYVKNDDGGDSRAATTAAPSTAPAATTPAELPRTATTPAATTTPATAQSAQKAQKALPVDKALGQTLAGSYLGPTPSDALLGRIRRGELGSVILFAGNVSGGITRTRAAVDRMQDAAKAGGNPPLLVMTDQEGGIVKRLPGPPDRAAASMTSASVAQAQGKATGRLLRKAGVNFDLAPVVDVKRVKGSFLGTRAFATDPVRVAQRACAFAAGLRTAGVGAALKHFPGLGRASGNTDDGRITITSSAATIRSDYAPYERCAGAGRTAVMMSNATYPKLLDPDAPAVLTAATYSRELGRAGVPDSALTISDDLNAAAINGRERPGHRALVAGLDLLLYAGDPGASAFAYTKLLAELKAGDLPAARVRDAAAAVLRFKAQLPD
ncbi:Beta-hexosaminidase [Paraconexibacter sp. AEG42_29]|uniref:beta-N-acetylhexosaminidase n=1 Tax=Paraconexibacter sp. AEG42_29 TaxID=2997339 RepID=A0AAU7B0R7_9ACTN